MSSFGRYLIFPEHCLESTGGGGRSDIVIIETDGAETRNRKSTRRRRHINISGAKIIGKLKHQEWETFCDLVEDEYVPFLFRDIRRSQMTAEPIGTGNGTTKTFQLGFTRALQGQSKFTPVLYADHDYPPRYWPTDPSAPLRQYWPPVGSDGLIHVFANGVEVPIDVSTQTLLDTLRYSGIVTLQSAPAAGAAITATGYFYHLLRFNAGSPQTTPHGGDVWTIESGIEMIEPKGGK